MHSRTCSKQNCETKTTILLETKVIFVTPDSLKFNLNVSRVELVNYFICLEGVIILFYDHYRENK